MCQIYGLVAYWFEHRVYFCTNTIPDPAARNSCSCASNKRCSQGWTMLFAQLWQVTKAAARGDYISLASSALSLWATITHISSLHEHVATRKILECPKNIPFPLTSKYVHGIRDVTSGVPWKACWGEFSIGIIYGKTAYVQTAAVFAYRRIPSCLDTDLEIQHWPF